MRDRGGLTSSQLIFSPHAYSCRFCRVHCGRNCSN